MLIKLLEYRKLLELKLPINQLGVELIIFLLNFQMGNSMIQS